MEQSRFRSRVPTDRTALTIGVHLRWCQTESRARGLKTAPVLWLPAPGYRGRAARHPGPASHNQSARSSPRPISFSRCEAPRLTENPSRISAHSLEGDAG
jgi:hypothetical protein